MLPVQQNTGLSTQEINLFQFNLAPLCDFFSFLRLLKIYWLVNKWFVRLMLIVPASTVSAAFRWSSVNFIQYLLWESHGCLEVSHPRREHLWWWIAFWWGREVKLCFFNHLLISFILFPFFIHSPNIPWSLGGIRPVSSTSSLMLLLSHRPRLPASLLHQTITHDEMCSMKWREGKDVLNSLFGEMSNNGLFVMLLE